jgi:N-hydroxyarylamine O-acetyltransferase
MTADLDLSAYFARIGWSGPARPDLATLAGLQRAHMASIPFENFDVLLGRPIRLDLAAVQAKLVDERRGGYCFEHATLFAAVLDAVGFAPIRHVARVTLFAPRTESPRTHMVLVVPLGTERFVVDPGFGALAARGPIALADGAELRLDHEAHRLVRDGAWWVLQAEVDGIFKDAWATTLDHDNPADFAMGNHYTATHPSSPFVNRVMLRALTPEGRVTVMNQDATIRRGSESRRLHLADRAALRALVAEHFGFDLPEIEQLRVPTIPEW